MFKHGKDFNKKVNLEIVSMAQEENVIIAIEAFRKENGQSNSKNSDN